MFSLKSKVKVMKSLLKILVVFSFVSLRCWAVDDDLNFVLIPVQNDNHCLVKIQQSIYDLIRSFVEEIDYHYVDQLEDYNFYHKIYQKQCHNQFAIQKQHFHLKKLKKVLKSCLNQNQFKILEKAEKDALRFHFIFCKADEEHVKIIIMKLMKLCLNLREQCLRTQSSSLLNCLKMILQSDLSDNPHNIESSSLPLPLVSESLVIPLDKSRIHEVIPAVTPSVTSKPNEDIIKPMETTKATETTTKTPEKSTSFTVLLVVSSAIATPLLVYAAYKMKARLLQLFT